VRSMAKLALKTLMQSATTRDWAFFLSSSRSMAGQPSLRYWPKLQSELSFPRRKTYAKVGIRTDSTDLSIGHPHTKVGHSIQEHVAMAGIGHFSRNKQVAQSRTAVGLRLERRPQRTPRVPNLQVLALAIP
jgi:hypothetical protein